MSKWFNELELLLVLEEKNEYLGIEKKVNLIKPVVSVSVATYQHGKYIAECLDSILMQKTDFDFEIIVGEDASTDGTREICEKYAAKHPDKIRLFLRDRKTSQYFEDGKFVCRFNGMWNRMSARGEYIAICEGDDYWTDPNKLQTQIDFLNNNPSYVASFHDCIIINENGITIEVSKLGEQGRKNLSSTEIVIGSLMPTLSVVYRNLDLVKKLPEQFATVKNSDTFLFALLGQYGGAKFHDNIKKAVYRVHVGGIWSLLPRKDKVLHNLDTFKAIYEVIAPEYKTAVGKRINERYSKLCVVFLKESNYSMLFKTYFTLILRSLKYFDFKHVIVVGKSIIKHHI